MVKKQIQSTIQCDTCKRSVETAVTRPGEVENFLKDLENEGWVFKATSYPILLDNIKEILCPACKAIHKAKLRESGQRVKQRPRKFLPSANLLRKRTSYKIVLLVCKG